MKQYCRAGVDMLFASVLMLIASAAQAQQDSAHSEQFSIHAQTTVITQYKPSFHAKYSGDNSLITKEETQTSITSTLYAGARLWKGASIFINPEIAGGSGLTSALGVGDATNGETFRVGSPSPKIYLARLFYTQLFALSAESKDVDDDFNQLRGTLPARYLAVTIGKISMADFFDDNSYSHDPLRQFMAWSLMSNGAWDYPANVRGYTPSVVVEYVNPLNELRAAMSLVPDQANGNNMVWNFTKASSLTLEYTHRFGTEDRPGAVRLLIFYTTAGMGNYRQSIREQPVDPVIVNTRHDGNTKYGIAINVEQQLNNIMGVFARASWNDGNHETWMFTEIDHSLSLGISANGLGWKRPKDVLALACVTSGLSSSHHDYLQAGGKGFMLGDGNLNYGWERLLEAYYAACLKNDQVFLTLSCQLLGNPGYNRDRGPVQVLSARVHYRL